jgi:hypothetical protein
MRFDWINVLRGRLAACRSLRRDTLRKGRRSPALVTERLEERSLLSAISVIAPLSQWQDYLEETYGSKPD